ncbi:MAG TPA: hypothetical protein VMV45_10620 [Casimicrobiaceae bacterium]|nr:hypothetical protein [Casimicrobiaceae bacterium]
MDVREFVKEALLQIWAGTTEAVQVAQDNRGGADASSSADRSHAVPMPGIDAGSKPIVVEFDIAVCVRDRVNGTDRSTLSLSMPPAPGGSATEEAMHAAAPARLRFSIPLEQSIRAGGAKQAMQDTTSAHDRLRFASGPSLRGRY